MSETPVEPPQIPTKVKAWVGFAITLFGSIAAVVTVAIGDGQITAQEWWGIAVAVATSIGTGLGVYAAPRYKSL